MTADVRAAAVEENLAAHYAYLGTAPGAQMGEEGDLLWVITGVMSATQNGVARARLGHLDPGELDRRIEDVMRRFRERRVNMSWWVGQATEPADLGTRLEAHGLPRGGVPGMAADLNAMAALEETTGPAGIEVVPVETEAQLWQWVWVHGYDYTEEDRRAHVELYAALGLGPGLPWRHFLGLLDGEPVGASSLFLGGGAAGLYNVATVPGARGRGVGTAVSLAPLRVGRAEGYRLGVLQSSAAGNGLYRRIGFERCCQLWQHYWVPG